MSSDPGNPGDLVTRLLGWFRDINLTHNKTVALIHVLLLIFWLTFIGLFYH